MPLILCNYDGFYMGLMHFLKACDANGTLAAPELKDVLLADSNEEVRPARMRSHMHACCRVWAHGVPCSCWSLHPCSSVHPCCKSACMCALALCAR